MQVSLRPSLGAKPVATVVYQNPSHRSKRGSCVSKRAERATVGSGAGRTRIRGREGGGASLGGPTCNVKMRHAGFASRETSCNPLTEWEAGWRQPFARGNGPRCTSGLVTFWRLELTSAQQRGRRGRNDEEWSVV